MKEVYEKLEREIAQEEETIRKLEDEFWQERMKYGMQSKARIFHHNQEVNNIKNYIKGLAVAKAFLESEMNK